MPETPTDEAAFGVRIVTLLGMFWLLASPRRAAAAPNVFVNFIVKKLLRISNSGLIVVVWKRKAERPLGRLYTHLVWLPGSRSQTHTSLGLTGFRRRRLRASDFGLQSPNQDPARTIGGYSGCKTYQSIILMNVDLRGVWADYRMCLNQHRKRQCRKRLAHEAESHYYVWSTLDACRPVRWEGRPPCSGKEAGRSATNAHRLSGGTRGAKTLD